LIGVPESLKFPELVPLTPTLPVINPALLALAILTFPPVLVSSTAKPAAEPNVVLIKSAEAGRHESPASTPDAANKAQTARILPVANFMASPVLTSVSGTPAPSLRPSPYSQCNTQAIPWRASI
jgi:hypothetical protein